MIIAFASVFLTCTVVSTIVTLFCPNIYKGVAKINLVGITNRDAIRAESKVILSAQVLTNVIAQLHLQETWEHRYFNDEPLKLSEVLKILDSRLLLISNRKTKVSVVSIETFDDHPKAAADIANAIATSYCNLKLKTSKPEDGTAPEILAVAQPPLKHISPNRPLDITCGVILGIVLGAGAAGLTTLLFPHARNMFVNSGQKIERSESYQPKLKQRY